MHMYKMDVTTRIRPHKNQMRHTCTANVWAVGAHTHANVWAVRYTHAQQTYMGGQTTCAHTYMTHTHANVWAVRYTQCKANIYGRSEHMHTHVYETHAHLTGLVHGS